MNAVYPVETKIEQRVDVELIHRLHLCKKEVAPHRKTQSLYVDDKQVFSI